MRPAKANVVVAIPTNGSDGREHMSGVFDYVKEHPHWMVQTIHMRTAITNGMLDDALKGADGLILDIAYDIERLAKTIIDKHPNLKIVVTNDLFATKVLIACEKLGLKVPSPVTVIGCDNDPLVFSNTNPPLTSLQLPFRELGYKAAATLDRLLRNRSPSHRTIRVAGTHLFERGSSVHIPPATALVEKARAYIAKHACDGIRPNDVIAHVGVSRSLLNLRFRQVCGKSINEDIQEIRLAEVRRQLEKTKHTILQIGRDCGFNDPDHLKRVFKKRFGTSMRLYRNTYRSSDVQTTLPVCVTGAARP